MFDALIYVGLVLLGLCLGSFAGASVWRLRARQLVADKKASQHVDLKEYNKLRSLASTKLTQDHSHCLHCGYQLKWYDLVPIVSWLSLRGRCRQCQHPIGYFEPLIEVGMALFFVLSYAFWPVATNGLLPDLQFGLWLLAGVGLAILFAYDTKWFLLPDKVSFAVIGVGALSAIVGIVASADPAGAVVNVLAAVGILSGIYLILYLYSKGRWIGFGDVKLGLGLGLLLADWQLAILALFLANLIGCLVVIPLLIAKKMKRTSHVPFGPLLIVGMIIAKLAGPTLVELYLLALG